MLLREPSPPALPADSRSWPALRGIGLALPRHPHPMSGCCRRVLRTWARSRPAESAQSQSDRCFADGDFIASLEALGRTLVAQDGFDDVRLFHRQMSARRYCGERGNRLRAHQLRHLHRRAPAPAYGRRHCAARTGCFPANWPAPASASPRASAAASPRSPFRACPEDRAPASVRWSAFPRPASTICVAGEGRPSARNVTSTSTCEPGKRKPATPTISSDFTAVARMPSGILVVKPMPEPGAAR